MKKDELLHFLLIPVIIGLLGGFSALLFRWLISMFESFYKTINVFHSSWFYLISMPVVFWFSYTVINRLLINKSNVTLDNIAKKISITRGNFSVLKGFTVLFLTSLNIGFGVPLGREAPIAKLGGLFGEVFLKFIKTAKVNAPIYLGMAVSSAISATFNAPLAGIILGIEIIIGRVNTYIIIPMIVSCATAVMFAREFLGDYVAFYVPHMEFRDVYFYIVPVIGAVFGVLAVLMFYFFDMFRELRLKYRHKWSAVVLINGLIVGVLIFLVPESMGVGYGFVTELFKGGFGGYDAFIITVVKITVVILAIGSGLFGGLMSPSIFIGAFGGYFLGSFFTGFGVDPKVVALIGSTAMLSAISRAPLRSSVIIVELTHSYQMLIPSLIVGSISAFLSAKFEEGGYFKRSLIQKGVDIENHSTVEFLKRLDFSRYFKHVKPLKENMPLNEAVKYFAKYHTRYIPVVDERGILRGVLTLRDVRKHYFKKDISLKEAVNHRVLVLKEDSNVSEIVKILGLINATLVPYVDKEGRYVAMVDMERLFKDISVNA